MVSRERSGLIKKPNQAANGNTPLSFFRPVNDRKTAPPRPALRPPPPLIHHPSLPLLLLGGYEFALVCRRGAVDTGLPGACVCEGEREGQRRLCGVCNAAGSGLQARANSDKESGQVGDPTNAGRPGGASFSFRTHHVGKARCDWVNVLSNQEVPPLVWGWLAKEKVKVETLSSQWLSFFLFNVQCSIRTPYCYCYAFTGAAV